MVLDGLESAIVSAAAVVANIKPSSREKNETPFIFERPIFAALASIFPMNSRRGVASRNTGSSLAPRRDAGYFAADNASVMSSMRLEKPHSLSYQLSTFTKVPPITRVCVAS